MDETSPKKNRVDTPGAHCTGAHNHYGSLETVARKERRQSNINVAQKSEFQHQLGARKSENPRQRQQHCTTADAPRNGNSATASPQPLSAVMECAVKITTMVKIKNRKVAFPEMANDVVEDVDRTDDLPTITNRLVVFPVHLVGILAWMFHQGLTTNVRKVLIESWFTLAAAQTAYGYLLLRHTVKYKKLQAAPKGSKRKNPDNVVLLLAGSTLVSVLASGAIFVVLVLLGAPLSSHLAETVLLANHISLVVVYPVLVMFKMDLSALTHLFGMNNYFRVVVQNPVLAGALVSIVTTWMGVIPIPLDWDRPWQQWPITLVVGSYFGYFLGSVANLVVKGPSASR